MSMEARETWLSSGRGGTYIELSVTPGASHSAIKGVNRWRNCLEVAVSERARDGQANMGLIYFFSQLMDVPHDRINITDGHRSRQKKIFVEGITPEKVLEKISEVMTL